MKCSKFVYWYIVKRLNTDLTLSDCLFGTVKLTKNAHSDNSGYGDMVLHLIHVHLFLLLNVEWGKKSVVLREDNSSPVHADNRKKRYLSSWSTVNRWIRCY